MFLTLTLLITIIALLIILVIKSTRPQSSPQQLELIVRLQQLNEQNTLLQSHLSQQIMEAFNTLRGQLVDTLKQHAEQTDKQVARLTEQTDLRLKEISGQVDKRLNEGFEKTTATFQDVVKRLVLIDEAQKKITELSTNVVSLQQILSDKRSRGAYGEVQLNNIIKNIMPEKTYAFQHTFDNGVRADCVLFLPKPTGTICIDAKFPLENYQKMIDHNVTEAERIASSRLFKADIKRHIANVTKYIIPNQTADGAIMFIPAEAIFAEIHAHHSDLVEEAQRAKVWLTSPTTMMAILTTACSVLKDDATRVQIHEIQKHLAELSKDFQRFQERMNKLATHIKQAQDDVEDVNTSARKISSRFEKIERVEIGFDKD